MIFLCCTRLIPAVRGVEATNYHWFFFKAKHLLENLRHSDSGEYDQVPRASGPADGRPFSVWLSFCLLDFPKNMRDAWGFQGLVCRKVEIMGMKAVSQGMPAVHVVYFLHQWADPQDQFKGTARLLELRSFRRLLSMSTQGLDHWKLAVLQFWWTQIDLVPVSCWKFLFETHDEFLEFRSCHAALTGTEASEGHFDQDGCRGS